MAADGGAGGDMLIGRRVILAGESATSRMIAQAALGALGVHSDAVADGLAVIALLREAAPGEVAAVLIDAGMSGRDCGVVAASSEGARVPIIALIGPDEPEARAACAAAGVFACVPLPLTREGLADALRRAVASRERAPLETAGHAGPLGALDLDRLSTVDVAALETMLGDRAFIARLLTQFRESEAGLADAIQSALDAGDVAEARRLAHRLKGVAGNLRATAIFEAAGEIEKLTVGPQIPDPDAIRRHVAALSRALGRLSAEIDAARAHPPVAPCASMELQLTAPALSARLMQLCALLDACDLAAEELWAELAPEVGGRDAGLRERIDAAVEALRYEEAHGLARDFATGLGA